MSEEDLSAIMDKMESLSKQTEQQANELNNRIIRIEGWLTSLPGRIGTTVWSDVALDGTVIGLALHRSGHDWSLYCGAGTNTDGQVVCEQWMLLTAAHVELQTQAIELLPRLLEQMIMQKGTISTQLDQANKTIDKIERAIGLNGYAKRLAANPLKQISGNRMG
jgi:hypothetical protein